MPSDTSQHAYSRMLKATSTLAGAKVVTILISIVRTKALALLLGPSGMGVINLVVASTDLARVAFACGLDGATARKVAEASAAGDPFRLDHAYRVSARTALLVGLMAGITLALASPLLGAKVLGDSGKFWWFCFGAVSLLFTPLLGVQLAFLQGLRQSRALATCQIIASLSGAVLNVLLVALLGVIGGVVAFLPLAIISLTVHHSFLKRHRPIVDCGKTPATLRDSRDLLKLGSGFAINGIWLAASGWLNFFFIGRYYGTVEGPHQLGLYGAASTMSNLYIGILVSAMATEFYPSLVQSAKDHSSMNRLLNQQTMMAITIGVPITMSMVVLAPWILGMMYSREFVPGAELLRWMLVGMAIRFASCPLGFTLLAIGSPRIIVASELAMGAVMILSSFLFLQIFGLVGVGIALTAVNLLYLAGVMMVTSRLGVRWSTRTIALLAETFVVLALCLAASLLLPPWQSIPIGGILVIGYFIHLLFLLRKDLGITLTQIIQKLRNLIPRKNA
jgi:enterobacterial common antigen flippase